MAISKRIAAIGMMNNPSQNTGDENSICSMPTNTAASGIVGQKLLHRRIVISIDPSRMWSV